MKKYLLLFFSLTFFPCSVTQAQSVPSMAEISVELGSEQTFPLGDRIAFDLVSSNTEDITRALKRNENFLVDHKTENTLQVSMNAWSHFSGKVRDQHSKSSFVIDLEEESTKRFTSDFKKNENQPTKLKEIAEYVHGYINNPTYIHGFNIASVIANQRSGDCTEFAVLSTALARSLGIPARVIIGTIILEGKDQVVAYGHSWAEVWRQGRWHILDAALYNDDTIIQSFYLPALEIENEGPGYTISILKAVGLMPQKIKQLVNAPNSK